MLTPDGLLVEPWRNMAKRMAGFLENPAILFVHIFNVGIHTSLTLSLALADVCTTEVAAMVT
jgi:hypothetical protein